MIITARLSAVQRAEAPTSTALALNQRYSFVKEVTQTSCGHMRSLREIN